MNKLLEYAGILMLLGGIIGAVYFFGFFKTSVPVDVPPPGFGIELPREVNNIGLMADRQNGLMLSIGSAVLGALFLFAGHTMTEKMEAQEKTVASARQANFSQLPPKLCAHCGKYSEGWRVSCTHCQQPLT